MNLMILSCLCVVKAWVRIPLTWEIVFLDMKHFQEISSWDHALEGLCEIINTTTGHLQVCWFPLMQTSGGLVEMMRNDASDCNLFPLEISLSTVSNTPNRRESLMEGGEDLQITSFKYLLVPQEAQKSLVHRMDSSDPSSDKGNDVLKW